MFIKVGTLIFEKDKFQNAIIVDIEKEESQEIIVGKIFHKKISKKSKVYGKALIVTLKDNINGIRIESYNQQSFKKMEETLYKLLEELNKKEKEKKK